MHCALVQVFSGRRLQLKKKKNVGQQPKPVEALVMWRPDICIATALECSKNTYRNANIGYINVDGQ